MLRAKGRYVRKPVKAGDKQELRVWESAERYHVPPATGTQVGDCVTMRKGLTACMIVTHRHEFVPGENGCDENALPHVELTVIWHDYQGNRSVLRLDECCFRMVDRAEL